MGELPSVSADRAILTIRKAKSLIEAHDLGYYSDPETLLRLRELLAERPLRSVT